MDRFFFDVDLSPRFCGDVPPALVAGEARLSGALPAALLEGVYELNTEAASLSVTTMELDTDGSPLHVTRFISDGEIVVVETTSSDVTIQVGGATGEVSAQGQFTVPFCP